MAADTYGHLFENRLDEVARRPRPSPGHLQLAAAMDKQRDAELRDEQSRAKAETDDEELPATDVMSALTWADVEDPLRGVAPVLPNEQVVDLARYRARDKTAGQKAKSKSTPGSVVVQDIGNVMSQDIGKSWVSKRAGMSKARLVITAVVVEGRTQAEVARTLRRLARAGSASSSPATGPRARRRSSHGHDGPQTSPNATRPRPRSS